MAMHNGHPNNGHPNGVWTHNQSEQQDYGLILWNYTLFYKFDFNILG